MRSGADAGGAYLMFVAAVGCVLGAWAQAGCETSGMNTRAAEILWLPVAAGLVDDAARPVLIRNGRSIYVDGSGSVTFTVVADCDEVAREISDHFDQPEWRPRSRQDLNPQLATSIGAGCQPHGGGFVPIDSNGRPILRGPYNRWHGEWENDGGDLVTYIFGGAERKLRGHASYLPREVVEERGRKPGR